jgi:hypothetical protein
VQGKAIVASPVQEQVQVLNLMDALKKSVAQAQAEAKPAEAAERPPKMVAPSTAPAAKARKRKSS